MKKLIEYHVPGILRRSGKPLTITVYFALYDFWVGVYWDSKYMDVHDLKPLSRIYIQLVPCLGVLLASHPSSEGWSHGQQ